MKYDLQQTTKLVTQLQQAHRLAAAFYMRILPLFDTIAYQTLCSEFWFWEPTETYTPPRDTYPPSGTSAWCYLPLFASTHAYRDKTYSKAVKGDKALIFRNYIDYDFRSDSDLRAGKNTKPDPLEMSGKAAFVHNHASEHKQRDGEQ